MPGLSKFPADGVSVQKLMRGIKMGRDKFDKARARERRNEVKLAIEKLFQEAEKERVAEMQGEFAEMKCD